jgi:excisionase family DNA binding protein
VQPEDLAKMTESTIAMLLGVSRRMVRKYLAFNGLPYVGTGRKRLFDWPTVLEWYLLYRVEIARNGGHQRNTLAVKIVKIRNQAASEAKAKCSDWHQKRAIRERRRMQLQMEEMKRIFQQPRRPSRSWRSEIP